MDPSRSSVAVVVGAAWVPLNISCSNNVSLTGFFWLWGSEGSGIMKSLKLFFPSELRRSSMWDLLEEVSLLMSEDGGAGAEANKSIGSGEVELTPESKWLPELISELKGSKDAACVLKGSSGTGEWPDEKAEFPGFVSPASPSKFGASFPPPDSKDMSSSKSVVGLELCITLEDSWSASTFSKSSKFKESRFDPADPGSCCCCWPGAGSMGPNFENWSKSDMMRICGDTHTQAQPRKWSRCSDATQSTLAALHAAHCREHVHTGQR